MGPIVNLCAFNISSRAASLEEVADDRGQLMTRIHSICSGLKKVKIVGKSALIASLYFNSIEAAKDAVIGIWELRLQGVHYLTPVLASIGFGDEAEIESSMDEDIILAFLVHIVSLRDSEAVEKCKKEAKYVHQKLLNVQAELKRLHVFEEWQKLHNLKRDLSLQHHSLMLRLSEFGRALDYLECYIKNRGFSAWCSDVVTDNADSDNWQVLDIGKECSWQQLHCLLEREYRRFQVALPLYIRRSDILNYIQANQVVLLIGETGSGKSTQLVQYLADAGLSRDGKCIVCTQPRKVAAMALSRRLADECTGCYRQAFSVRCFANSVFKKQQALDITYMTDYALLQFCINDENLGQFSCVVVDEAHERSLNTDLLLALLKSCLPRRPDLKVVIMSASPDTELLSTYFDGCKIVQVPGRAFPVDVQYEPDSAEIPNALDLNESHYALQVVQKVSALNDLAEEGNILAFLTSQAEVEWACSQSFHGSALVLPFHGKLQHEDQLRAFEDGPSNVRKIVFATNLAETSLTIPGVRYVVDSGMAKESFFDPKTGVNALEVGFIDQSAALQRAGRAGRTQPGICYRLYSKLQFEKMEHHRKPEILRVHLGVAILKLLALGIKEPETFNFVQAPSSEAISSAMKTLHHLGAIEKHSKWKLTTLGFQLQKLGMEPHTGKILLDCIARGYAREGLALAALMSSFGTVFFRAGTEEEKARADRLKMKFCHPDSDLFTLLLVYQEWELIPFKSKKRWCLNNSINHKTLQRCQELIKELESCLYYELNIEVSQCWAWSSSSSKSDSMVLQKIIFSVLIENLAVFSGYERLGYDVVSSMQNAYLHPSSALLVYGNIPKWVVFVQLICTSKKFLHCVTVIDPEWLHEESVLCYDAQLIESSVLHKVIFSNLGAQLLRNISGKQNQKLLQLQNLIRREDRRCIIEPDYEKNELRVFVTSNDLQSAKDTVEEVVQRERRWLHNQCSECRLFQKVSELDSPAMLFGSGAMVRDILMPGEFASVEVFHPEPSSINEAEILVLFDKCGEGIGSVQRYHQASRKEGTSKRWGVITLRSFISAKLAVDWISEKQMGTYPLTVVPIKSQKQGNTHKSSFDALKATLTCLRRQANGIALIKCEANEMDAMVKSCRGRLVCGSVINCYPDRRRPDSVCFQGLKCNVFSSDVENELRSILQRPDLHVWIHRRPAPLHPSNAEFQNALEKKISSHVPVSKCEVVVSPLGSDKDCIFKAFVKFDESQLEAAETALQSLHGLVLPNCQPWQALRCHPLFSTALHCNSLIFKVLKEEFDFVIRDLEQRHKGVTFSKELTGTGGYHIQISATSLSVAAGCRATLEKLMEGTTISDDLHEQGALSILFTKEGLSLAKRIEIQTNTYIAVDRRIHSVKVYGPKIQKDNAVEKITSAVEQLHEKHKGKEILLRGEDLPQSLMKEVVQQFGADLVRLQDIAGVPIKMDQRRQSLHVYGETEAVQKVQAALAALATSLKGSDIKVVAQERDSDINCSVCFSPLEDRYSLEGCGHSFCRSCLVDQITSLIRHREGFPLACTYEGCGQLFLIADIEALLSNEQQEELRRASLSIFVAASRGSYKFCTTPDCPVVYRSSSSGQLFTCPACSVRLCTSCHVEYHEGLSCELYRTYRQDPDASLQAWRDGKEDVKDCPSCHCVIEKIEGCNHVTCKCGMHVCWICLTHFGDSSACYSHLREMHGGFV